MPDSGVIASSSTPTFIPVAAVPLHSQSDTAQVPPSEFKEAIERDAPVRADGTSSTANTLTSKARPAPDDASFLVHHETQTTPSIGHFGAVGSGFAFYGYSIPATRKI